MSLRTLSSPRIGLIIVVLGAALPAMDLAVNVAFPAIAAAFQRNTGIHWLVASYVVTYASLMLAFGELSDRIGYRRVFRAGLWTGVVAYTLCALSPSYGLLLFARFLQGISTALILSCAPALATLLFAEVKRTRVLATYSGAIAASTVIAPILGGIAIEALGWSGVFWIRLPLALAALLLLRSLPEITQEHLRSPPFDRDRAVLLSVSVAALLLAAPLYGRDIPLFAPLLSASIGVLGLAVLLRREQGTAQAWLQSPVARHPEFLLLHAGSVLVNFAAFPVALLVPFYFLQIGGYSSIESGAALSASPAGVVLGSAAAARTAVRVGKQRTALLGVGALIAANLGIAHWGNAADIFVIIASLALHGVGVGLFQLAYMDAVLAMLPREVRGIAGSLTMITRTVGVVASASFLTLAIEATLPAAQRSGRASQDLFLDGFSALFMASAALPAAFLMLICVGAGVRQRR